MPNITFSLPSGKYESIALAIKAYNQTFPDSPVADENEFAKEAAIEAIDDYLNRFVVSQIAIVKDRLMMLNSDQWVAVTNVITPMLPSGEAPTE